MSDQDQVSALLQGAQSILVAMHVQPDGDTTGSALALWNGLTRMGKRVAVVCRDPLPERFTFLPGADRVVDWIKVRQERFDVAVAVDCGDVSRLGPVEEFFALAPVTVNIDHHTSNPGFAQVNFIDGQAAATGEMVAGLIRTWRGQFSREEAICLYTAISTDTLSFRQINTRPDTLALVAELTASGFDLALVNERLWESQSPEEIRLLGWALLNARLSVDGRVAWLPVPRAILNQFQATDGDVDALVHHLRTITSVVIAIVTKEMADGQTVKVSWRGKSHEDVSRYAQAFGGGGHRYAAAAQVSGSLQEVTRRVIQALGVDPDA